MSTSGNYFYVFCFRGRLSFYLFYIIVYPFLYIFIRPNNTMANAIVSFILLKNLFNFCNCYDSFTLLSLLLSSKTFLTFCFISLAFKLLSLIDLYRILSLLWIIESLILSHILISLKCLQFIVDDIDEKTRDRFAIDENDLIAILL
jgi:hypothetical protein